MAITCHCCMCGLVNFGWLTTPFPRFQPWSLEINWKSWPSPILQITHMVDTIDSIINCSFKTWHSSCLFDYISNEVYIKVLQIFCSALLLRLLCNALKKWTNTFFFGNQDYFSTLNRNVFNTCFGKFFFNYFKTHNDHQIITSWSKCKT